MRASSAILGSAAFFLIAPVMVGLVAPWWIAAWRVLPPLFADAAVLGGVLTALGAIPLVESFGRFALEGRGTPAPVAPTQTLVVTGFYRFVRNPMYLGVLAVILGQTLILGDLRLLGYAAIVATAFALFVRTYEEPTLHRQFGNAYRVYCENVPRWRPRLTPWNSARPE